ncbi:YlmH/Sll1252 family protein [uncultured Ilyobacter sp.]|uniref:YlmH family RNA-binding protein n=1 Tax=uncultured Ilyobacter sp. TaxID=544433 RepID=UPI0029C686E7|nr:YlmH/Sll1252 family protein [uncultured Ilyobacter sp.]
MDKKNFLNNFTLDDRGALASLYEDVELCKKIQYPIHTRMFFPPEVWSTLENMKNALGVEVESRGVTQESEKRVILIKPMNYGEYDEDYPFTYFEIKGDSKFKELEHRHFLAAIMGLGIKREILGDLIVRDGMCYGAIFNDLYNFLENNLTVIGRIGVSVFKTEERNIPEMEFEEGVYLVSSLRLDSIVAAITEKSRSTAAELIKEGAVNLNYSVKREKDFSVKEGDVITIRRKGKFLFKEVAGTSKKGKQRVVLKKYK